MPAVGLTDHGSLAGAVDLYKAARDEGVKPLIGCEVYVTDDRHAQQKGQAHLTLLAETNEGYANLIRALVARLSRGLLLQAARRLGAARDARRGPDRALRLPLGPRLQGARGEPPRRRGGRARPARADLRQRPRLRRAPERAPRDAGSGIMPELVALAGKRGLPTVATGDVHYLRAEDARAHEALLCIQSGDSLKNPSHWKFETDHFYFKTPQEMALDFPGLEDAMRRTLEVAERCNVEIELDRILLPRFDTPDGRDAFEYLVELVDAGVAKRYATVDSRASRAPPVRAEDDQGDGLLRLLPHRLPTSSRFARAQRGQRRAGPRLVGWQPRRILPRDHRHRPARLRPPVRADAEPGPQVDAGHGSRLRRRGPRARHQLRAREIRPRPRRPDHHVRDDGRPRGGARRRARARPSVRRRSTASRSSSPKARARCSTSAWSRATS